MVTNSLVKWKCKACSYEGENRRLPRRCTNCRAYLAIVGCEIVGRTRGKIEVKKLKEAKDAKIEPETEEKPITEPKPEKPAAKPKTPAQPPKKFELEPSNRAELREIREKKETYDCGKCGAKITKDMKKCSECGVELNWDDIYE